MNRPRVLVFAYACEPDHGSEPGVGWLWSRMVARTAEVWVITRANNRPAIEAAISQAPEREELHFIYVDLPAWARFWKRGQRGVHLYYLLWQVAALARTRAFRAKTRMDLVWHLTLSNGWMGSVAPFAGGPFVYGPIGGGVGILPELLPSLGVKGAFYELARATSRAFGRYLNPLARLAWRRATLILVQNRETRSWLPPRYRSKARVFPNVVLENMPPVGAHMPVGAPTALFAGRLLPLKGIALGIRAVAATENWRLLIIGEGPDKTRLQRLANILRVSDRVDFQTWLPRHRLIATMGEADLLLFPSLHDEAGWVVAEAMACGLPIVCLDHGGPPVLTGPAGPVSAAGRPMEVVGRLAGALNAYARVEAGREAAALRAMSELSLDAVSARIAAIVGIVAGCGPDHEMRSRWGPLGDRA